MKNVEANDQKPPPNFRDVRSRDGRLLFRFDPVRDLVEIKDRGKQQLIDLQPLRQTAAK